MSWLLWILIILGLVFVFFNEDEYENEHFLNKFLRGPAYRTQNTTPYKGYDTSVPIIGNYIDLNYPDPDKALPHWYSTVNLRRQGLVSIPYFFYK